MKNPTKNKSEMSSRRSTEIPASAGMTTRRVGMTTRRVGMTMKTMGMSAKTVGMWMADIAGHFSLRAGPPAGRTSQVVTPAKPARRQAGRGVYGAMTGGIRAGLIAALVVASVAALGHAAALLDSPEDAILSKGFAASMDGRDKVALSYFEEVRRINPKNDAARKGLEKVRRRIAQKKSREEATARKLAEAKTDEGRELLKTGDAVAAIDAFHAALDASPRYGKAAKYLVRIKKDTEKVLARKGFNLSEWTYARGVLAYLERDWAKAFRIWSERLRMEPENVALANATLRAENKFAKVMVEEREEFLRRGAREFYRQGLYRESLTAWKEVLAMRDEDREALEGFARAENELKRLEGDNRDQRIHSLLERGLEQFASEDWKRAKGTFQDLLQVDPEFEAAKEYVAMINEKLRSEVYVPVAAVSAPNWREERRSNQGRSAVIVPGSLENLDARRAELESQLKRDPTDIQIQQELGRIKQLQNDESEKIYKDGLIAYSQGNRGVAIDKWKQVLVLNPDHKKAAAALRKARAEEERSAAERE